MRLPSTLLLPAASAVAGATFVLIEVAGRTMPAVTVAAGRTGIGWLTLRIAGGRRAAAPASLWRVHLVALTMVTVPFFLLAFGQQRIPAGLAAVLVATAPLLTAAFAPLVLRGSRWHGGELVALAAGLAGVALAVGGASATLGLGAVAVLGSAVGFALGGLLARRLLSGPPMGWATAVLGAATLQLLLPALLAGAGGASTGSVLALVALGTIGTGGVFLALFAILERDGPTRAALLDYGAPAFGVLYAAVLLGEELSALQGAGIVLIAVACVLHVGRGLGAVVPRTETP